MQFQPYLADIQRRALDSATKPPVDPRRIESGEATAAELMQFLAWERQQDFQRLQAGSEAAARRASSENQARGDFSAATLGAGRDYDTLRGKYLEPAYRTNPQLRDAIAMLSPEAPAIAEMYTAAFLHIAEQHGGNHAKALKAIFDGISARTDTEQDITTKTNEAARRGAEKIARGQHGPGPQRQKVGPQEIWNMDDATFSQLQRQHGV